MGNFKQLFSGGGYDLETHEFFGPFSLFSDVAHALDGILRWTGATSQYWSVARHSVLVSLIAEKVTDDPFHGAAGLIHDLHEFIVGDIATPIARAIGYKAVEDLKTKVQAASEAKLGISQRVTSRVLSDVTKHADRAALFIEKEAFLNKEHRDWGLAFPPREYMEAGREALRSCQAHYSGAHLFIDRWVNLPLRDTGGE